MKTAAGRFFINSILVMIAALFLVGTVPSFAAINEDQNTDRSDIEIMPAVRVDEKDAPKLKGTSVVLMDLGSGSIVYEKNADKVREPASLTKVLTCLIALEEMDPEEVVTVHEGIETEGSVIGLVPGEKITVEQLIYGMMLESGNDAAEALAFACDGNLNDFADRMNERAADCGAGDSNFKNPNGLNEVRDKINRTTARDMAMITAEAMENEKFREIVSTPKHTIPATNKSEERKLVNSNLCLWDKETKVKIGGQEVPLRYKGCTGVKTGMTSDAGYCFIGTAKRDDTAFLVVSLNTDDELARFRDAIRLWDFAFERFDTYTVLDAERKAGVQRVSHGSVRKVEVSTRGELAVTINKDEKTDPGITTEFLLDEERLEAPVTKDTAVGKVIALDRSGRIVGARTLYTDDDVPVGGPLSYIGIEDREAPWILGAAALLILIIIVFAARSAAARRKERRRNIDEMRSQLVKMRAAGEGMTPREWSELTGDPRELPMDKGPSRLTDSEIADLYIPEITKSSRPLERPKPEVREDPNKPRRHGRMNSEEIEALMAGKLTGDIRKKGD